MQLSKRNNFKQMLESKKAITCGIAAVVLCCLVPVSRSFSQNAQNPKPADDDVVRVQNDLVQTDVMVFDKEGRFVNGLKQSDFELRVDGKTQPVQFFERSRLGAPMKSAAFCCSWSGQQKGKDTTGSVPLDRGRTADLLCR
jgi:hypothetical protein